MHSVALEAEAGTMPEAVAITSALKAVMTVNFRMRSLPAKAVWCILRRPVTAEGTRGTVNAGEPIDALARIPSVRATRIP